MDSIRLCRSARHTEYLKVICAFEPKTEFYLPPAIASDLRNIFWKVDANLCTGCESSESFHHFQTSNGGECENRCTYIHLAKFYIHSILLEVHLSLIALNPRHGLVEACKI